MEPTSKFETTVGPLRALLAVLGIACALLLAGVPTVRAAETVDGTIVARHSDDFAGKSTHATYLLKQANGRTLRLAGAPQSELVPGRQVEATGEQTGETLQVSDIDAGESNSSERSFSGTSREVAVILVNFTNDTSEPWTPSQVGSAVFTGSSSVSNYFQEQSSQQINLTGKLSSTGDVFGWYHINSNNAGCDYSHWETLARQQAAANGDVLSGYDHYVFIWPDAPSCNWAGLAYLPGSTAYINGTTSLRVISHELSHNLGIHHASSYRCLDPNGQRTFISSSCTTSEYGDPFTVMGGGSTYHSHALAKTQLGFLPSANMRTVTGAGTYTITNEEQSLAGETQLLRLPRAANQNGYITQYYYLDLRQPFGSLFDTFSPLDPISNGVSIRLAPDASSRVQAKLLDANPATSTFSDSPLQAGQSVTDPATGVSFTTLDVSAGVATVRVDVAAASGPGDGADSSDPPNTSKPVPATAPKVTYSTSARRLLKTHKLTVTARCNKQCRLTAKASVRSGRFKGSLRPASGEGSTGERVTIALTWPKKALRAARKAFKRDRSVSVELKLDARSGGLVTHRTKRIKVSG